MSKASARMTTGPAGNGGASGYRNGHSVGAGEAITAPAACSSCHDSIHSAAAIGDSAFAMRTVDYRVQR